MNMQEHRRPSFSTSPVAATTYDALKATTEAQLRPDIYVKPTNNAAMTSNGTISATASIREHSSSPAAVGGSTPRSFSDGSSKLRYNPTTTGVASLRSPPASGISGSLRKSSVQDLVARFDQPGDSSVSAATAATAAPSRLVSRIPVHRDSTFRDAKRTATSKSPARIRRPSATQTRRPSQQSLPVVGEASNSSNNIDTSAQQLDALNSDASTSTQHGPKSSQQQQAQQAPLFGEVENLQPASTPGYGIPSEGGGGGGVGGVGGSMHRPNAMFPIESSTRPSRRERRASNNSESVSPGRLNVADSFSTREQLDGNSARPITPIRQTHNVSYGSPTQQSSDNPPRLRAMVMAPPQKVSPTLRSSRPRQHISTARSVSPIRDYSQLYTADGISPSKRPYTAVRDMDMPTRRDSIRKALRAHSSQMSFDERAASQMPAQSLGDSAGNNTQLEPSSGRSEDCPGPDIITIQKPLAGHASHMDSPTVPDSALTHNKVAQKLKLEVENIPASAGEAPMTGITEFEDDESPILGVPGAFPSNKPSSASDSSSSRTDEERPDSFENDDALPDTTSVASIALSLRERDSMLSDLARRIERQSLGGDEAGTIQIMLSESPMINQDQEWQDHEVHRPPLNPNELMPDSNSRRFSAVSNDSSHSRAGSYRSGQAFDDSDSYSLIHQILEQYRDSRRITDTMISKFHEHLVQNDPELAQRQDTQAIAKATLEGLIKEFGEHEISSYGDSASEALTTPHSLDESRDPFMYGKPQAGTFLSLRKDSADPAAHGTLAALPPRSRFYSDGIQSSPDLTRPFPNERAEAQSKFESIPQRLGEPKESGRLSPSAGPSIGMARSGSSQSAEMRKQELNTVASSNLIFDQKPTLPEIPSAGSLDLGAELRASTDSLSTLNGLSNTSSAPSNRIAPGLVLEKPATKPLKTSLLSNESASFDPHPGQRLPTPELPLATPTSQSSLAIASDTTGLASERTESERDRASSITTDSATVQKRLKQRRMAIKELLDTEFKHGQDMKVVEDIYKGTANAVDALSVEDRKVLFGNISQVAEFSVEFLTSLKKAAQPVYYMPRNLKWTNKRESSKNQELPPDEESMQSGSPSTDFSDPVDEEGDRATTIGACFGQYFARMEKIYGDYIKNHDSANARLVKLQTIPQVKLWLSECHAYAADITEAWNLDSLLVKPVQRCLKYALMLKQLLDATTKDHPDFANLDFAYREIQNIAARINEQKRRAELLEQVVNGNSLKKKDFDATLGLSRAFGRKTEKIRQQVGLSDTYDDKEYKSVAEKFGGNFFQLQVTMRDMETYKRETLGFMKQYVSYMDAIEGVMDVGYSQYPELESKWRKAAQLIREMSTIAWPEHEASIQKHCIEPIMTCIKLYEGPDRLMGKRKKRILEYAKYMAAKNRGEKPDKKCQELGEQFLAINESLKEELPKLYAKSSALVTAILMSFVHLKVQWYMLWGRKLKTMIDSPPEPESLAQIVQHFKEDFSFTDEAVLNLKICNGVLLANLAHVSQSFSNDDWSNASTKRPSISNSAYSSTTELKENVRRGGPFASPRTSSDQANHYGSGSSQHTQQQTPHQRSGSNASHNGNLYVPHAAASWSNVKPQTPTRSGRASHDSYGIPAPSSYMSKQQQQQYRLRTNSNTTTSPPLHQQYQQQYQSQPQQRRPSSSSTYFSATTSGPVWQPQSIPGGNQISPITESRRQGTSMSAFSSALPMDNSPTDSRRSSEPVVESGARKDQVMFLAASLFEFDIDRTRTEAGHPYLTYVPGEVFDVIGQKGELWLARNQDDATSTLGWIWEKHFVKLVSEE